MLVAALASIAVALAVAGFVLGRHLVEVEPGPPVELDYNGSSLVVAAPYSSRLVAEPMRLAGRQLSPCVEYTLSVDAEGLRGYRYLVVLVAGNSSVGLYAEPGRSTAPAVLCADAPAEVAMARSVVVEAGPGKGRLEAVLTARPVEPEKAEPGYWPAWAWPGAYAVYDAIVGSMEARVLDAGPGYAVVEQRTSDSLGLGITNETRVRVGFDEANGELVFYTRKSLEQLLKNATRQGCSIEETRVDVADRRGVEALRIACPRYTLYISPGYGLLLRASADGVYVELEDTNILPGPGASRPGAKLRVLPASRVYANGTLVLELEARGQIGIAWIEACGQRLPGTELGPGRHVLRLQLPGPPTGSSCTVKIYTEAGNVYTALVKLERR